jgi:hypothetical protein
LPKHRLSLRPSRSSKGSMRSPPGGSAGPSRLVIESGGAASVGSWIPMKLHAGHDQPVPPREAWGREKSRPLDGRQYERVDDARRAQGSTPGRHAGREEPQAGRCAPVQLLEQPRKATLVPVDPLKLEIQPLARRRPTGRERRTRAQLRARGKPFGIHQFQARLPDLLGALPQRSRKSYE